TADVGLMLLMAGAGFTGVMVKLAALEVPPPGEGLKTVTEAEPALATSLAGMEAVSLVSLTKAVARSAPFQRRTDPAAKLALTKLVARLTPFQSTTDTETKLLPRTVRLNPGPCALAEAGLRPEMLGTGFEAVIVNVTALDVPSIGVATVTLAVPGLAMSVAG